MVTTGARMAYHRGVPWTDQPPSKPGVHRCRLKAGAGTDQTPFDVKVEWGTITGSPLHANDILGFRQRLGALYPPAIVEWWTE